MCFLLHKDPQLISQYLSYHLTLNLTKLFPFNHTFVFSGTSSRCCTIDSQRKDQSLVCIYTARRTVHRTLCLNTKASHITKQILQTSV